ncbi:MAG: phosphonate ABC transporter ATP-binding protein [Deltaproteobacteria bacterium]|nr:phosphonate ABC transporter ATP-binding protein [Candidatus Anaeroferrophillus wilburensis]MBN2890193.1 phosphonate ABC transporter ATP-binding protein [Deltaproteobacteria bacterium]
MISLREVTIGYVQTPILQAIDLRIEKGEFVGIIGLSGAGKSTLLKSMIGKVKIFSGEYQIGDHRLNSLSKSGMKDLRSRIGFIFQGYNLVNRLSVLHNIMSGMLKNIPLMRSVIKLYNGTELEQAYEYMKVVGIEGLALKRCDELSGGERQRTAIARALAQEPEMILADEPVAALDLKSAAMVMDVMQKVNQFYGVTVVVNLHHLDMARHYCSRIIGINDGQIVFDGMPGELCNQSIAQVYRTGAALAA